MRHAARILVFFASLVWTAGPSCTMRVSPRIHQHMTRDEMKLHLGTDDLLGIPEYDVFVPQEVDLPADLTRSAGCRDDRGCGDGDRRFYSVQLFGTKHLLNLTRDMSVAAAGLRVVGTNGEVIPRTLDCFFTGEVQGLPGSSVALSTCNGLHGVVVASGEDFVITPMSGGLSLRSRHPRSANGQTGKPHIVYRRSSQALDDVTALTEYGLHKDATAKPLHPRRTKRGTARADSRNRLSPSRRLTIELALFVDRNAWDKVESLHEGSAEEKFQWATTYYLSVINTVQLLYNSGSLGHRVQLSVLRLRIIEGNEFISDNNDTEKTLHNFCKWQHTQNHGYNNIMYDTPDDHPEHWDHAVFITGMEMCRPGQSCAIAGMAPVSGMCSEDRSCSLNEDSGLGSAFLLGHEIGHNLGMRHDGDQNNCADGQFIMATHTGPGHMEWSPCSADHFSHFLLTDQSDCLNDSPSPRAPPELALPTGELPGERYTADQQCELRFGEGTEEHKYFRSSICTRLTCLDRPNHKIWWSSSPAAEGTSCGTGKWCRGGECVLRTSTAPAPIDGGWSIPSEADFGRCSLTCGTGVVRAERSCNNPVPANGGRYCVGERLVYKLCNTQPCSEPEPHPDVVRGHQCQDATQSRSNTSFTKSLEGPEACELWCQVGGIYNFFGSVADGTSCGNGRNGDVCVGGACKPVGCDGKFGSSASYDQCGVCQGDGSTCKVVEETYKGMVNSRGVITIATIPKGSYDIRISTSEILRQMPLFIVLKNEAGDMKVIRTGRHYFMFAGAAWKAERFSNRLHSFQTKGKLTEGLTIQLASTWTPTGAGKEKEVLYRYHLPVFGRSIDGGWSEPEWSACSRTCGTGVRTGKRLCNSPLPANGGRQCQGDSTLLELCETECTEPVPHMDVELGGVCKAAGFSEVSSLRGYTGDDACRLWCQHNNGAWAYHGPVPDGMPCSTKDSSICVKGSCKQVGCDGEFGSSAEFDTCGVCNGDGSTCSVIEGTFTGNNHGTSTVVTLPESAYDITISSAVPLGEMSRNLVGLEADGERPLRPNAGLHYFFYGGAGWKTTQYNNLKLLFEAKGPLTKPVEVTMVHYTGISMDNKGITYKFNVLKGKESHIQRKSQRQTTKTRSDPSPTTEPTELYVWVTEEGECSKDCAGGTKSVTLFCQRSDTGYVVGNQYCQHLQKPHEERRIPCNLDPCPVRWRVGTWGECSRTCGEGVMVRSLTCTREVSEGTWEDLDQTYCDHVSRPTDRYECNIEDCVDSKKQKAKTVSPRLSYWMRALQKLRSTSSS
ncbi:A disintegrin and metalloproteinase with thrombospondin motifs 6-like [Branchiostoma floridae x Branchiostoma japonicum]